MLVVDSREYRNRWVEQSHGYLGSDPCQPMALLEAARSDLARYPEITFLEGRATAACQEADGRFVVTVDGAEHAGLRLILAMGVVDRFPEVDGFFDHYGTSVFHCTTCDGYEAQDRRVVILGWGEQVVAFATGLLNWARQLTVVTEGRPLGGDERHREMLARQLGCEIDADGCLCVDRDGRTTVEGCFAAGDITPGFQLASIAVGKGAAAGVACALSLQGQRVAPGSPAPAPDAAAELESG